MALKVNPADNITTKGFAFEDFSKWISTYEKYEKAISRQRLFNKSLCWALFRVWLNDFLQSSNEDYLIGAAGYFCDVDDSYCNMAVRYLDDYHAAISHMKSTKDKTKGIMFDFRDYRHFFVCVKCCLCGEYITKNINGSFEHICVSCRTDFLTKEKAKVSQHIARTSDQDNPNKLTLPQWISILEENSYRCVYCGADYEELDHVYPVSKGGLTTKDNCVPSCASCNRSKSANLIEVNYD